MNKKHIVTSIGVVLLTTGVIGGIWSGIDAMPKVINNIQKAEENYTKEELIYKNELNLTKLNIDSSISGVIIKKYNGKDVVVERNGNKDLSNISAETNNTELTIREEYTNNKMFTNSVDDMVRYFVNQLYSQHYSDITVYVPENIDINIKTTNGRLYVSEDINLNNVSFDTQYGSILLDSEKKIKNLSIKSDSDITMQLREIYATENLNIEANSININENNYVPKDDKLPESVRLSTRNDSYDYSSIYISTKSPIAKNLNIDSRSTVDLDLPLLDYKFNFDVKTSRGIDFSDYNYERYMGTTLEKYFKYNDSDDGYDDEEKVYSQKELIGLLNEELKDNPIGYNINIKSAIAIFN